MFTPRLWCPREDPDERPDVCLEDRPLHTRETIALELDLEFLARRALLCPQATLTPDQLSNMYVTGSDKGLVPLSTFAPGGELARLLRHTDVQVVLMGGRTTPVGEVGPIGVKLDDIPAPGG